ncbi:MAG: AEC family transporter [Calditerrivibrio sp.]|nr:AEC family transporter [Calditerrivibrio sp.]
MIDTTLLVLPIFIVVLFGYILKRFRYLDEHYIKTSNKLTFNFFLPTLLFYEISKTTLEISNYLPVVLVMMISVFLVFVFSILLGKVIKMPIQSIGTFAMNNFRANYAYMGLPVAFYAFGKEGLAVGSILMAIIVPFVNLLSVVSLSMGKGRNKSKLGMVINSTLINPIAFSCILGLLFSFFRVELPVFLVRPLEIVSKVALPIALIGIGATINLGYIRGNKVYLSLVAVIKLMGLPFVAYLLFQILRMNLDLEEKILIIMLSSPPATVNFVLADMMDGDRELASGSIMISTLLSVFSFIFWLTVLKN